MKTFMNRKFLLCFLLAWCITNGWAYAGMFMGTVLQLKIMRNVSMAYLGLLWLPCTPEKIITLFIARGLLKILFKQ